MSWSTREYPRSALLRPVDQLGLAGVSNGRSIIAHRPGVPIVNKGPTRGERGSSEAIGHVGGDIRESDGLAHTDDQPGEARFDIGWGHPARVAVDVRHGLSEVDAADLGEVVVVPQRSVRAVLGHQRPNQRG